MDEAVQQFVSEDDQELCRIRYRGAVVALPAGEGGRVVLKTQQGGAHGRSVHCAGFQRHFSGADC